MSFKLDIFSSTRNHQCNMTNLFQTNIDNLGSEEHPIVNALQI